MSTVTPAAVFAAVVDKLAPNSDEAAHMRDNGPKPAQAVGRAVLAALKAGRNDTEAGCRLFLAALAPGAADARDLARNGNRRQRQVSKALLAAQAGAAAVVWTKPALGRVAIAAGPGDVQTVAGQVTVVRVALKRAGDLAVAAACGWRFDGLPPSAYVDTAVFGAGEADAAASVTIPVQPGMVGPAPFSFQVQAPFVGLDPTPPPPVQGRLLPPGVAGLPTVSLTGPGDVTPSATAPTDASATVALSSPTDRDVTANYALTGQQDGDLLTPAAGPVAIPAGRPSVAIAIQAAPMTLTADRPLSLAISGIAGADPAPPPALSFSLLKGPTILTGGPPPIDLSGRVKVDATPATLLGIISHASPGQAVRLAPGTYPKFNINNPKVVAFAENYGTVTVGGDMDIHAADSAILNLVIHGHVRLMGDRARASRFRSTGGRSVDGNLNALGTDCVFDRFELDDFLGIGLSAIETARRPWFFGGHVHDQNAATVQPFKSMAMLGHSHTMSALPINARLTRCLLVKSPRLSVHDGIEFKSANGLVEGCTVDDVDCMVRHGSPAARFLSVVAIGRSGGDGGGFIRLTDAGPQAIRCKTTGTGQLVVEAGTVSGDQLRAGAHGYAYAQQALVAHHDGKVVVGWQRSGWNKPPLGTRLAACLTVQRVAGDVTEVVYTGELPPAPVQLTPADVGPRV